MSEALSVEELARIPRDLDERPGNFGTRVRQVRGLLATIDARDTKIARLEKIEQRAKERIAYFKDLRDKGRLSHDGFLELKGMRLLLEGSNDG